MERTPQAVCLVCEDQKLSFEQLNARANQLAHHLRRLGVRPEVRVGLCVPRSVEMMVGLLGILKAGGAYVPLDPEYPSERLAYMLQDAQISVIVTHSAVAGKLPGQFRQICLDQAREELQQQCSGNPLPVVAAENLAYVIYTSGSTGRPKGVAIRHASLGNFLTAMNHILDGQARSGFLALTSVSFDISILELFWTLCRGDRILLQTDPTGLLSETLKEARGKPAAFSLFYFAATPRPKWLAQTVWATSRGGEPNCNARPRSPRPWSRAGRAMLTRAYHHACWWAEKLCQRPLPGS